jgi:hypothetical protein
MTASLFGVSGARCLVCGLSHLLDRREALVPSGRDAHHLPSGLSEALVAH